MYGHTHVQRQPTQALRIFYTAVDFGPHIPLLALELCRVQCEKIRSLSRSNESLTTTDSGNCPNEPYMAAVVRLCHGLVKDGVVRFTTSPSGRRGLPTSCLVAVHLESDAAARFRVGPALGMRASPHVSAISMGACPRFPAFCCVRWPPASLLALHPVSHLHLLSRSRISKPSTMADIPEPDTRHDETPLPQDNDEPQCRICLDGEDPELGRLIRPCLCKGSVSVSCVTRCTV